MSNELKIKEILYECIKNNKDQDFERVPLNESYLLLAENSDIDSLELVNIIVDFESELSVLFGKNISLMNDNSISSSENPFYNVNTLCQYTLKLI